jgi:multiple sugar transport system substrate-binding protein
LPPTQLKYQHWATSQLYQKAVEDQINNFVRQRTPGTTVEYITQTGGLEYTRKLTTLIAASTVPDVFWISMLYGTSVYVQTKNVFADPEPRWKRDAGEVKPDDFWLDASTMGTWRGRMFGIPRPGGAHQNYFFNLKLFDEAGLETPDKLFDAGRWSYDTLLEVSQKLTKRAPDGRAQQFGIVGLVSDINQLTGTIWAHGATWFDKDFTKSTINSPEGVAAITYAADLVRKHKVSPQTNETDIDWIATGKMGLMNTWISGTANWAGYPFEWDIVPQPKGPAKGDWETVQSGNLWCMPTNGKNNDLVWELIKHSFSPNEDQAFAQTMFQPPMRKSSLEAYNTWLLNAKKRPRNVKYHKAIFERGRFMETGPEWVRQESAWKTLVSDPLQRDPNADVKAALDKFAAEVNGMIKERPQ